MVAVSAYGWYYFFNLMYFSIAMASASEYVGQGNNFPLQFSAYKIKSEEGDTILIHQNMHV